MEDGRKKITNTLPPNGDQHRAGRRQAAKVFG